MAGNEWERITYLGNAELDGHGDGEEDVEALRETTFKYERMRLTSCLLGTRRLGYSSTGRRADGRMLKY